MDKKRLQQLAGVETITEGSIDDTLDQIKAKRTELDFYGIHKDLASELQQVMDFVDQNNFKWARSWILDHWAQFKSKQ